MIQRHWELSNTFEHYGRGDFGMLGWDALREPESLPLFNFAELGRTADAEAASERYARSPVQLGV